MALLWILINVMCTVNIRGQFLWGRGQMPSGRDRGRGQKEWGRGWGWVRMIWPRGHMGPEALTSLQTLRCSSKEQLVGVDVVVPWRGNSSNRRQVNLPTQKVIDESTHSPTGLVADNEVISILNCGSLSNSFGELTSVVGDFPFRRLVFSCRRVGKNCCNIGEMSTKPQQDRFWFEHVTRLKSATRPIGVLGEMRRPLINRQTGNWSLKMLQRSRSGRNIHTGWPKKKYTYRMAQKVAHFSTHRIFGIVQNKMKRISPKCS